ncbi:MAG: VOC family protein, partial [Burkholderiales bacterium]|nr:VOC family protein [Burkholderiales bacterium]MDE1927998.1 VOC family protein [Burkholderiales bacterium]MDE2157658.1 VOC family protein [Burkholderiales bacterium]MDE2501391.1 VOC family protein [Burkholderiales bacterium]
MQGPTAYLRFEGDCEEALSFYCQALGAKVLMMSRYSEAPGHANMPPVPEHWIIHGRIQWPDGGLLMGSDGGPTPYTGVHGISLSLNCADRAEGERLFQALAAQGEVKMPFGSTFWSPGFGMLVDRFGVPWMVNVEAAP